MCCIPKCPNFSLVNLESRVNSESESHINDSDLDLYTDSIYFPEFGETFEQWCTPEVEQCKFNSTSVPPVDLHISREENIPEDFIIPTREEILA